MFELLTAGRTPTTPGPVGPVSCANEQSSSRGPRVARTDGTTDGGSGLGTRTTDAGPVGQGPSDGSDSAVGQPSVLPLLGTLLTVGGLGVGLVVGFDTFGPRTTVLASAVRAALVVGYVAVCLLGTVWIRDDARTQAGRNHDWTPRPWAYLGGGTVVVGSAILWVSRGAVHADPGTIPVIAGIAILSGCLASVPAGPVYLIQRCRRLGRG
jgi:hypothetical protein